MASGGWKTESMPVEFLRAWREQAPETEPPTMYRKGQLTALVGREDLGDGDRWHISIRYGDPDANGRIPTWEELVAAAHELRPGVPFAIGIPPRSWWINVHPHVLHLYEIHDDALVAQWRAEARGDLVT
jgi:hypothetical protein